MTSSQEREKWVTGAKLLEKRAPLVGADHLFPDQKSDQCREQFFGGLALTVFELDPS